MAVVGLALARALNEPAAPRADDHSVEHRSTVERRAEPSRSALPLDVEYGGCETVMASPDLACVYTPGSTLRIWIPHHRPDDVELRLDGQPGARATPYTVPQEHGHGVEVRLDQADIEELSVAVENVPAWRLRLRSIGRLSVEEHQARSELHERFGVLQAELRLGSGQPGPPSGELSVLLGRADRLIDDARTAGLVADAVTFGLAVSYHVTVRYAGAELARERLEQLRPIAEQYPAGRAGLEIYLGHTFLLRDRLVDAAARYRAGGLHAVRTDDLGLQFDALGSYAEVLAKLGYYEAADHWGRWILRRARAHGKPSVITRMSALVARAQLALREAGQPHEDPRRLLESLVPRDEPAPTWVRLALARLAILDGRPAVAREHLLMLAGRRQPVDQRVEAIDLDLWAMSMQGAAPRALRRRLDELQEAAERAEGTEARWRAQLRRGVVLEQLGDDDGALRAYEDAQAILDRLLPLTALGISGEVPAARRGEGTRRLVELLVRRGQADAASCAVRRAQWRMSRLALLLRRVDPKLREALSHRVDEHLRLKREHEQQWARSVETASREQLDRLELAAASRRRSLEHQALELLATHAPTESFRCARPEPAQLVIALLSASDALIVLASDDVSTSWHRVPDFDPARPQIPSLLAPLDELLERAERIRVLASGTAASVAVHAQPWRGRPLALRRPVVYGLELPSPAPLDPSRGRAVVLADPQVEHTLDELSRASALLRAQGLEVESIIRGDAPPSAIWNAVRGADHFHYAGHVSYDAPGAGLWPPYPGGASSVASHIVLGEASRLEVSDVLMLEHVPRTVVLMGCNTGVSDARAGRAGFSLATAFLGAGAHRVVASTRNVEGADAAALAQALYSQPPGSMDDPGTWMMKALVDAHAKGMSEGAIGHFRVLVP